LTVAELPLDQGIPRLRANESRLDKFVNGSDSENVTPATGDPFPTLRKFLATWAATLNASAAGTLATKADKTQTIPASGFATSNAKLDGTGSIVVPEASATVAKAGTAGPEGGAMSARQTRTAIDDRVRLTQINTDDYPDLPSTARRLFWDDAGYVNWIMHSNGLIESTSDSSGGASALVRPAGHAWDPGVKIFEAADGTITCDYDHLAQRAFLPSAADHLIYIDAAAAGGGDGSAAAPYNSLTVLSGLSGKVHVRLKGGTYGIAKLPGTVTNPTNLQIEVMPGTGPAILTSVESGLTWAPHASVAGAWSATLANAPGSVADEQYLDAGPSDFDGNLLFPDQPFGEAYARVTDDTALGSVDTWRYSGGAIHVHPRNGASADTSKFRVYRSVTMLSYATTGTLWISGDLRMLGGTVSIASGISSPRMKIHLDRVLFAYSKYDQNAVSFLGAHDAYAIRSACHFGALDGWNYHGTTPHFFEFRCSGQRNGWGGGGANNGSTGHDGSSGVRAGGNYTRNRNRNGHDVGDSTVWNVYCDFSYPTEFNADTTSGIGYASGFVGHATTANKSWVYRCRIRGCLYDLYAPQDVIYTDRCETDGTVAPGSSIIPYVQV
jgi:hypothetical protein